MRRNIPDYGTSCSGTAITSCDEKIRELEIVNIERMIRRFNKSGVRTRRSGCNYKMRQRYVRALAVKSAQNRALYAIIGICISFCTSIRKTDLIR